MLRYYVLFTVLVSITGTASADIVKWGGSGTGYTIVEDHITIWAGGEYKFYSETSGIVDDIDYIDVLDTFSGTVTLQIVKPDGSAGASNIGWIDLTETNVTGNLDRLNISGNLATDGDVSCDSITGAITVTGTLDDNDVAIHKLMATNVTAAITLGGLYGDIEAGTLDDLTIGNQAGITAGNITISEEYAGSMSINAVYSGCIHLLDDLSGSIASTGTFYGRVEVDGDVVAPSWAITISENIIQGGRGGTVNTKKFLKRAAALEQCF